MLILTEIAEAVNADRKDKHADVAGFKEYQTYYGSFLPSEETRTIRFREDFEAYIKNTVEDELADIVIRCFDLAGLRGIDLSETAAFIDDIESMKENKDFIDFCYMLSGIATCDSGTDVKTISIIGSVLSYCKFNGIGIEWFIEQKMKYNKLRPYRHGGKKY